MWEIFSQMIDGNEKEIIFLDNEDKILLIIFYLLHRKNWKKTEKNFQNSFQRNWLTSIKSSYE